MSFSIGPLVGKKEAVIRTVKAAEVYGSTQGHAVKTFIVTELEQLPPDADVYVSVSGHHNAANWELLITIKNRIPYETVPVVVE